MKLNVKVILLGLVAGLAGAYLFHLFSPSKETVYIERNTDTAMNFASNQRTYTGTAISENFVEASAQSTPSVVYITTTASSQYNNNWMDWFFNGGGASPSVSSGSGVIFTSDGYIVTNNHVIEKADKIEVTHGKRTYDAKLVGTDASTDLAVLKIEASNLPAIKIGSSQALQVGEWVLAVGNPFNLTSTVTAGIVSAKTRIINIVNSQFPIESFIQTDAAINPGNSGGALVNMKGELVGINTAILSRTGSYTGYGFAVPIDIVKKIVNDLKKYGIVQKAFPGADVTDITTAIAEKNELKDLSGVLITYIQKDGAAEKAGLQKNDVILKVNEHAVDSKGAFDEYISYFNPGDKIKVTYKSGNATKSAELTLTNKDGNTDIIKKETYKSESVGADFEIVSKVERDKLGIENGVKIVTVRSNGLVRRLGLQEGFIITAINRVAVSTPSEVVELLEKIKGRVTIEGISANGSKGYYQYYF